MAHTLCYNIFFKTNNENFLKGTGPHPFLRSTSYIRKLFNTLVDEISDAIYGTEKVELNLCFLNKPTNFIRNNGMLAGHCDHLNETGTNIIVYNLDAHRQDGESDANQNLVYNETDLGKLYTRLEQRDDKAYIIVVAEHPLDYLVCSPNPENPESVPLKDYVFLRRCNNDGSQRVFFHLETVPVDTLILQKIKNIIIADHKKKTNPWE